MKNKSITRRDFLKAAAITPVAGALASRLKIPHGDNGKSRVVLIRDKHATLSFKNPNPKVIQSMLDESVSVLLEENDPVKAWKQFIKPNDIVGIKTNVWRYIPTTTEVEQAIKQRVLDAGVKEKNIDISDRGVRRSSIFKNATALINARPMRTHHWSGVGSCIKNYIMFESKPYAWHNDSCADLAKIWKENNLLEKTKLNILVMLNPLFHGIGPHHYSDKYVWEYKGILVSTDPVAVDATGVRIIEAKRREHFKNESPLKPPAKHIYIADTKHHIGESSPDKIELIKLGWKENILI